MSSAIGCLARCRAVPSLVALVVVALVALTPVRASAAPTETVLAGARVTSVTRTGTQLRITIDRGRTAGVTVGLLADVFPLRVEKGRDPLVVDLNVRQGRAKVIQVTDTSATLVVEGHVGSVDKDAFVSYELAVRPELAELPLFRVTARGIELRPHEQDVAHVTIDALLADPAPARLQDKVIDAMIADVQKLRATVVRILTKRIEGGPYHGKMPGQIVDELDRAQVIAYLHYLEAYPVTFLGHRSRFADTFFAWVINGTESGERFQQSRRLRKTLDAATAAARAGKLDEARRHWQAVLATTPDWPDAVTGIRRVDTIGALTRQVASDPDDTSARFQLASELFELGDYSTALTHVEQLRKRTYDPFQVERLRGRLLVRLKQWKLAQPVFEKLVREHTDDKDLAMWLQYTRASARVARSPADPAAHMELAIALQAEKAWSTALTEYRVVLDSPRATAAQRAAAMAAQERISIQRDIEMRATWARNAIRGFDQAFARTSIERALERADEREASALLDELAELARSSNQDELALELLRMRVKRSPSDGLAHNALAFALLGTGELDEATAMANRSLTLTGDRNHAHLILAYIARRRGDLVQAEALARKATAAPKYGWPYAELARAEAARGNWQQAITHSARAIELVDSDEVRAVHTAATRGLQAHEALQADPSSPRERLRLARSLAQLGLVKRHAEEVAKLPATGTWRAEAWWALAMSDDYQISLDDRLTAARASSPSTPYRKRQLAMLEARAKLRTRRDDAAARKALASLLVLDEHYQLVLATLVPLLTSTATRDVADLAQAARQGLKANEQLELARAALARTDHATALQLVKPAQDALDRVGAVAGRVRARGIHSQALANGGRHKEAIALAEEAHRIAVTDGEPFTVTLADQQVGRLKGNIGTAEAQERAARESLRVCEALDNERCLLASYSELAWLDTDNGRGHQAIEHARKAWTLAERLGRPDWARAARVELAKANLVANRYTDAEQIGLALLSDSRTHEDVTSEQLALMVLGYVATYRGQGALARERFRAVYELGARAGNSQWRATARRYEGLAWLRADHDAVQAARAYEQSVALYAAIKDGWSDESRGGALRELAEAYLLSRDLAKARTTLDEARKLAEQYGRTGALASVRATLAMLAIEEGKGAEAASNAKLALDFAQKTEDVALLWNVWYTLARSHELAGQRQQAADAYEQALTHLSRALLATGGESEQLGYLATGRVRDLYTDAIELFLELGKQKRAEELLAQSRYAVTKQQRDAAKLQTKDPVQRAMLDRLEAARARIQGLEKQKAQAADKRGGEAQVKALGEQIAQTEAELKKVILDLRANHRALFRALAMDPQSLHEQRKQLPKDSVLVEYFMADDALYAFVIAASLDQPAVIQVKVSSAELGKAISQFRDAVINETDEVEGLARKLDDWLLEPLRSHIAGASTVILLPFGPLYYVPFDALIVSGPGEPVRYAIEDLRITVQTSDSIEHLLAEPRPRASGTMLAISNPDGTLPGAQREVSRIVKTALPDAQVLGRKDATIKKVQDVAGSFRFLHLATHGVLDADPRKSYLKLANGNLSVSEIAQLDLKRNNELVVLSACETAVEQGASAGDDMVTIATGFAMAGAPALVASLWEVDDESTAELMAMFYRALVQGTGDRLDALRSAKLNLMRMQRGKARPFGTPWHWSGFQLYGDFRAPRP